MNPSSYNHIPYESLPISYTYLPHLASLGRLLGLETTPPEHCRVVDIGCAEGNNIIPMASFWPESEFVGIDLSEVQIESGRQMIQLLALSNIQLHVEDVSLMDVSDYGKFDYILLHGIFSWVEEALQHRILDICQSLLAENGLIYISYNTYPGWHAQMVIRDAMKLYCKDGDTPEKKMRQIPKGLDYFKQFFKVADDEFSIPYAKRLDRLEKHSKEYLYHEYLEEHNNPLYFKDFIAKAGEKKLAYLSDALLAFDNTLILGQQRNHFLQKFDDRIERLQYMDFMINQRFRRSLLCHSHKNTCDEFAAEQMASLAYRANLKVRGKPALNSEKPSKFYQGEDKKTYISISHPVSKAALQLLAEAHPSSIDYMVLLQQASQLVVDRGGLTFVKEIELFYQELYLLLINDWISMDTSARIVKKIDWDKPLFISELSWKYAERYHYLPTFLQGAIDIDELAMQALTLLREGVLKEDLLIYLNNNNNERGFGWRLIKRKQIERQLNIFLEVLERNNIIDQFGD